LTKVFSIDGISKSPSIFDYDKLEWFNGEYIRMMSAEEFLSHALPVYEDLLQGRPEIYWLMTEILQPRITRFSQIEEKLSFLKALPDYDPDIYIHKKSKTTRENSLEMLGICEGELSALSMWDKDSVSSCLISLAERLEVKNALVMWPVRIAVSGTVVTPGGAVEILLLLGREESLRRIQDGRQRLTAQ